MPLAASLADAIRKEFNITPQLIGGKGGVLDITVDGDLVFSKHKAGYKPTPDEVVNLLKSAGS